MKIRKDVPPMPTVYMGSPYDMPDDVMETLVKEYGQPIVFDNHFVFRTPKGDEDEKSKT